MTVETDTAKSGPYAGAGLVGPYPVTFRFLENSHLQVVQTSGLTETTLILNVDYTVVGAGGTSGSVSLTAPLPSGQSLTIIRRVPVTQLTDYVQSDSFPAASHENALDKLTMIAQQQQADINGAIRVPESLSDLPLLPAAAARVGNVIVFDALGNPALASALPAGQFQFGVPYRDKFPAGSYASFPLSANPGLLNNIRLFAGGVEQFAVDDWTWTSADPLNVYPVTPFPTDVKFEIRYTQALPIGSVAPGSVSFLGESTGSALVGFQQTGSSILQTIDRKLRQTVNVFDFMSAAQIANVKANALTLDVTTAIQAALNTLPSGGELFFPAGSYRISAPLTVAGACVSVRGKNHGASKIVQYTANAKIFDAITDFFGLSHIRLDYAVTPTAGGTAINCAGNFARLHNFYIGSCHIGVNMTIGVGGRVWAHDIRGYVSSAVVVTATNDHFFADFIYDALNSTNGALGGIRLFGKAEAITFRNGDVLNGVYSMTTDGIYSAANRPAYCNFTDVFFDSAALGVLIDKMVMTTFMGCWWSGGRSGGGFPGLSLLQTDSLKFVNCEWFGCGTVGASITASAKNTSFVNPSVHGNSLTAGAGVANGLDFANGSHDFSVIGGSCTNGLSAGSQGYGIFVGTGCTNYSILGVNVAGNVTGGILDGSSAGFISKCPGFVTEGKGSANVIVGQTVVVVNHGLSVTPTAGDIVVTPLTSPSASSVATWYVTSVGASTFQIATNAAVAGTNLTFAWQARTRGA